MTGTTVGGAHRDAPPALRVVSRLLPSVPRWPLTALTDADAPLVWSRDGDGIAGCGEAFRIVTTGPDRFRRAASLWRDLVAAADVDDTVGLPGSGLVAFGTFAFADESATTSVLVVPRVVTGRRDGVAWVTRIDDADVPDHPPVRPSGAASFSPGDLDADGYRRAVAAATSRIRRGDLRKVVLARDARAELPEGTDLRDPLSRFATTYPGAWTFAVDGFVGASPETLVAVRGGEVRSRVLAGSVGRGGSLEEDRELAWSLVHSAKDAEEHSYAVRSVVDALSPVTTDLESHGPFAIRLPNLWHLASDVRGRRTTTDTSLDLAAALHPTAAVAGAPRQEALELIRELEPFDRERYAGPVGWLDAAGDGEWAVALRCAQVRPDDSVTAWAGCGVVGDSEPERELEETRLKFRPVLDAIG